MQAVSVVIIAKNEAHLLAKTLQSVKLLSDDIIVCDTGSSDATIPIALKNGAVVIEEDWMGYGLTKNIANESAVYDWILQLDADEAVDEELLQSILALELNDEKQIFTVHRKNYFKEKYIHFGEWWNDEPYRLFNRNQAAWNGDPVHEKLIFEKDCVIKKLKGSIVHKTLQSTEQYKEKLKNYAIASGEKYFKQGKRGAWYKQYLSPVVSFMRNYFLRLGFLDGREGFLLASMLAGYTQIKYKTLYRLQHP
jgi:glycosyltransferase involved in cell wall biosynthesis